jgi:transcriptional regulator with XRE-family HTH domain
MVLLRRVIGDALRARRQGQHRTLREVSSAANVSLGYLSEIERGQKEASSELLAAICDALGARLSEVLGEVSDTLALAEQVPGVLLPVQERPAAEPVPSTESTTRAGVAAETLRTVADGGVRPVVPAPVGMRQEGPLKATLHTAHRLRSTPRERDVVCAA